MSALRATGLDLANWHDVTLEEVVVAVIKARNRYWQGEQAKAEDDEDDITWIKNCTKELREVMLEVAVDRTIDHMHEIESASPTIREAVKNGVTILRGLHKQIERLNVRIEEFESNKGD